MKYGDEDFKDFVMARAQMSSEFLEEAIVFPKESICVDVEQKNVMSVNVPVMNFKIKLEGDEGSIYPRQAYNLFLEL